MAGPVPIQNLYYLFCYAWNRFPEGHSIDVGTTESPEILDLFAHVLAGSLRRLLRRGLDRGYVEIEEACSPLRGRIVLDATMHRNLLLQGRAICRFEELKHDILHNQIIKATLRCLAEVERLDVELAHELRALYRRLEGVSNIRLSEHVFRRVQLSGNSGYYDLVLKICGLVYSCLLPDKNGHTSKFADLLDDEKRMSDIFEKFVRNFYKLEQSKFSVKIDMIPWDTDGAEPLDTNYLPMMKTDVSLRSDKRTIVIDTKYYRETLSRNLGSSKVRSDHLYQLFAYLKNLECRSGPDSVAAGVLLYPTVGQTLNLQYTLGGHSIAVKTVNLDTHWTEIHTQLLTLTEDASVEKHQLGGK
jgi:5-methylcytosine-specific restriction enzyme subunit McrC